HNFTSILRKVANVSDTVAAIGTYGRNKEVEYQMGKAGKELKRDMEFMCLNNGDGNIGTGNMASKFSGFASLCAPKGYIDHSTGAVTFKEVNVADLKGPWFKTSDLFDLTYNLYLAGSKANKIMFHPQHASTFSDFVSNNIETGKVYRMFDGVDTRFNVQVTKIRDPLGQKYDLIPNRFMPVDKVYIFNESDWTQMILRAPSATKLAKQGSSERFLLEAEVGLRHRHINASGVLTMVPSNLIINWTEKPTPITWGLGLTESIEVELKIRATGANVADGTTVTWSSSNPLVAAIRDATGQTADGKANTIMTAHADGTAIITAACQDGFATYVVTVKGPNIRLRMSNSLAEKGQKVLAIAHVLKADGTAVANGTTVNFKADPAALVELQSIQADTTGGSGTAQIEVTAQNTLGHVQLQCSVGGANSNFVSLEIVDKIEQLSFDVPRKLLAVGVNDRSEMRISVRDGKGTGLVGKVVEVGSTNKNVVTLSHASITTDANGEGVLVFTARDLGTTELIASFGDQELRIQVTVTAPQIRLDIPSPGHVGTSFEMTATVTRSDGSAVGSGASVQFISDPAFETAVPEVDTNASGIAKASYTPMGNSDLEIIATIGAFSSAAVTVTVE
ncbi:MAG: SU10 major capsid protein, partial [Bacteroidales bacterium]